RASTPLSPSPDPCRPPSPSCRPGRPWALPSSPTRRSSDLTLALTVEDNGGCYIVPAFSGLFAPHWRSDARGVMTGLTGYVNKGHIARAVLEATAWQTREVVDAMNADSHMDLTTLKVDGGMTADNLLMQILSD